MLRKRKYIEATIKDIIKFFKTILWLLLCYIIIIVEMLANGEKWNINLINTVFLLIVFGSISNLIKEIRLHSDEGGMELKAIYEVFLIFFLITIGCSYNLDKIKEIVNLSETINIFFFKTVSVYTIISYIYKALLIIKTAIEVVMIKDVVFQINGWNLNKTVKEYWNELLKHHKIYILHEDLNEKNPRLWLIRGDACADIIDNVEKCKIYISHKEYIKLEDFEAKEILSERNLKGFDDVNDIYEGESAWIFTPWKTEHFYAISLKLIDLSYYDEKMINELIVNNKEKLQVLPTSVKSCSQRNYLKILRQKFYDYRSFIKLNK